MAKPRSPSPLPSPLSLLSDPHRPRAGAKVGATPGEELHLLLRAGLPFAAFERLLGLLDVPAGVLAEIIGIAPRTLARRKTERTLSPIESDRLYRVAHIVAAAAGTLGSLDKARLWLQRDNRALGGATPLSLLDTEVGVRRVEEVLARIDHGIAS